MQDSVQDIDIMPQFCYSQLRGGTRPSFQEMYFLRDNSILLLPKYAKSFILYFWDSYLAKIVKFCPNFGIFFCLLPFSRISVSLRFPSAALNGLLWILKLHYYVGQLFGHIRRIKKKKYAQLCFFWHQNYPSLAWNILLNSNSWVPPLSHIKSKGSTGAAKNETSNGNNWMHDITILFATVRGKLRCRLNVNHW